MKARIPAIEVQPQLFAVFVHDPVCAGEIVHIPDVEIIFGAAFALKRLVSSLLGFKHHMARFVFEAMIAAVGFGEGRERMLGHDIFFKRVCGAFRRIFRHLRQDVTVGDQFGFALPQGAVDLCHALKLGGHKLPVPRAPGIVEISHIITQFCTQGVQHAVHLVKVRCGGIAACTRRGVIDTPRGINALVQPLLRQPCLQVLRLGIFAVERFFTPQHLLGPAQGSPCAQFHAQHGYVIHLHTSDRHLLGFSGG